MNLETNVTATANAPHPDARVLLRKALDANPFVQFERWLADARKAESQAIAMTLATNSAGGAPAIRTVLLKYHDEEGFVFFTESRTRKETQIAADPRVSLLFPWLALNRQVTVTGKAEKLSPLAAVRCMLMGETNGNLKMVESQLAEIKMRLGSGNFSMPSFVAYRIRPEAIEFWQGRGPRVHDRFLYSPAENGEWVITELD